MYRYLLLLLPALLFSKFYVTTTLPFESFIIKQIGKQNIEIKEITRIYSTKIKKLDRKELLRLTNSRVYFSIGLDIEKEYENILLKKNPNLIISNMSKDIKKIEYKGKPNPYIWLDPILLRQVAKNIYNTLINTDPYNINSYKENYEIFLNKLDGVYLKTRKELENSENYNIFVYDEYFDYYAKRFKINLYRKEKRIQRAEDINKLNKFVKAKQIKSILILENDNILMAKSIASHSKINIKEHDIFNEFIFINIDKLTKLF